MRAIHTAIILSTILTLTACSGIGSGSVGGSGSIEADEIRISPLVPGRITAILFDEGDSFKKGDVLVTLAREEFDAALRASGATVEAARQQERQALADFQNMQKEITRVRELFKAGATSRQNLDQAETRFQVSQARLTAARAQVKSAQAGLSAQNTRANETILKAPVDGTVLSRNFEVGEVVMPGSPVLSVADLSSLTLKIYIPEPDLVHVKQGQSARVELDGTDRVIPAKVVHISDRAEFTPRNVQTRDARARLVFAVKLKMDNPDGILKPGMPADGVILSGEETDGTRTDR